MGQSIVKRIDGTDCVGWIKKATSGVTTGQRIFIVKFLIWDGDVPKVEVEHMWGNEVEEGRHAYLSTIVDVVMPAHQNIPPRSFVELTKEESRSHELCGQTVLISHGFGSFPIFGVVVTILCHPVKA